MKKISYLIATILLSAATLSLSSCLKDNRYVDFSKAGNFVDFPKGSNASFVDDAISETPDTDANGTIVRPFAVNVATANVPTSATTITLAIDNSIIASWNAAHPEVTYLPMPANAFVFTTTTVTIPAGKQYATTSVTFYKNKLDPSKSYMLPIKIAGTTGGYKISANQGVHYYHFIGNDFAGVYVWDYRRWQDGIGPGSGLIPSLGQGVVPDISALGQVGVINPVTPTEFQMITGYNGQGVNYDVTFTRTVSGTTVSYTNWQVQFLADDIAKWTGNNPRITNFVPPVFTVPPPATNASPKIFEMHFNSGGASPGRYIDDTYHTP